MISLNKKINRFYITLFIASLGGIFFSLLGIPIPWMLGPMTAVLISSKSRGFQGLWPRQIRDAGLVLLGYSIGLSLTKTALIQIFGKLPLMLLLTIILIAFCSGIAFFVSKLSGIGYPTVLTGSIPGGLSQMITFAEEAKGIDLTVVTFLQVTRVIIIIFSVPFLISSPIFDHLSGKPTLDLAENTGLFFPNILLFVVICVIFAFIGKAEFPYTIFIRTNCWNWYLDHFWFPRSGTANHPIRFISIHDWELHWLNVKTRKA
ncbi:membrane AbrB-like protein [Bacillus niacini]|uniref:Membrane AbrB-like protein n=1 Tax=Neobacillus niacini TaxID=86668 RepID=A0A852TGY7_9BACI|nr:membrane AbrB-like protein [Neobacillus niacini]